MVHPSELEINSFQLSFGQCMAQLGRAQDLSRDFLSQTDVELSGFRSEHPFGFIERDKPDRQLEE